MDEKNIDDIYKEFHPRILHYLKRLVGDHEAEDIAQIVFEKVNRNLSGFKGDAKLVTWIFRIATNTALDRLKSPSYKRSVSGPQAPDSLQKVENIMGGAASPDRQMIRDEMSQCVREFVDRLPPDYRTIICLNELQGFTNREIADILQITLENAKIRLHRARAQLKKSLEAGCDFYLNEQSELACDRKQSDNQD